MKKIKISEDFSEVPAARYPSEGDYSGQEFRENILFPNLKKAIDSNEKLDIDLDGTAGLGTSFLEESFGGLIRIHKLKYEEIITHINLISNEEPDYIVEIFEYLEAAKKNEK